MLIYRALLRIQTRVSLLEEQRIQAIMWVCVYESESYHSTRRRGTRGRATKRGTGKRRLGNPRMLHRHGRRHRYNIENLSCYKGTRRTWNRNNSHSFVLARARKYAIRSGARFCIVIGERYGD